MIGYFNAKKQSEDEYLLTNSINPAPKNTIASTKMNCITLSSYLRKNQRPIRGKKYMINPPRKTTLTTSHTQNSPPDSPLNIPPTTARTSNVSVSVTAVPPTAILTLRCRDTPYRITMGYATRVCEAYILANRTEVIKLYFKKVMLTTKPIMIGIIKANNPSITAFPRFCLKSAIFISRPAKNII